MKALIVIDIQNGYIEKYEACLLQRINQRIQAAKDAQEYIIYIKNTKLLRSGNKTEELAIGLVILSNIIFCKEQANAFSCKELTEFLIQNHINEVEIIGIDGNSCIAASARGAKELGYQVSLPLECIGIHNNLRFQKTRQMLVEKGINIHTTTP